MLRGSLRRVIKRSDILMSANASEFGGISENGIGHSKVLAQGPIIKVQQVFLKDRVESHAAIFPCAEKAISGFIWPVH